MKIKATKRCDGCGAKVATKHGLFWHTNKWYVTIKGNDITSYVNYEDPTTPFDLHYCFDCWNTMKLHLAQQLIDKQLKEKD